MGGVGKRIIMKTWMSEIFLQCPILRVGGDALIMQVALQFITYFSLKFDELSFFLGRAKRRDSEEVRSLFASGKNDFFVMNFSHFAKNTLEK
jgi:hypothetical protein